MATQPKTHAGFVPVYVLENIAKNGHVGARNSLQSLALERNKRNARTRTMADVLSTSPMSGDSIRQVYDSQQTWEQRHVLVRGEGDPLTVDSSVSNAYDYSGQVREFVKTRLGRDSIDNRGMDLVLNVHFGEDFMNAFWDGDEMTFGDGDGLIFSDFSASLDVVAHELAHGVTEYTANLEYFGQSGALNEHFSDVFGTAITQHINGETATGADWLIGDEIMGTELYGEALRSMREPGTAYDNPIFGKDPQPSHMNEFYDGDWDFGGVHINSGIPNKAFYLTAIEIGTDKAVDIWYHALQNLWPTAQFNDAVNVIVNSARLMVKAGKAPKGSVQVVRAAFKAVGLPA